MVFFALLFLERTEENYNSYIRNLEFNGMRNIERIEKNFYNTLPIFDSFETFLVEMEGINK